MSTKIEWAEETWNPITGCTPISEGCANCYAKRMSNRLKGRCGYDADNPFKVTLHPGRLSEPLKWRKPRMIFVCSMGDLFHEDVPDELIDRIFAVMASCGEHTFLLLTKRPQRMREYMQRVTTGGPQAASSYTENLMHFHKQHIDNYTAGWTPPPPPEPEVRFIYSSAIKQESVEKERDSIFFNRTCHWRKWPLSNVWLGVTAENQTRADERIPVLLQIPAAKRFVSIEPMLGPVDLQLVNMPDGDDLGVSLYNHGCAAGIDWVICGGETGPGSRPMNPDWVRSLRDQCQTAGTPFFFKSWGDWSESYKNDVKVDYVANDGTLKIDDPKLDVIPVYRVGKKHSGRLLDGREWNEYPGVS